MNTLPTNSVKNLLVHLGIVLSAAAILFLGFFFVYLPGSTNHGETITVPNLAGMDADALDKFLTAKDLRYEVSDSDFVVDAAPNVVITQYPKPGAKVKEGRKVYVSVTMRNAPMVDMPQLVNLSLRSAQATLQSYGLKLGNVVSRPDLALNAVLEQSYAGNAIAKKDRVPKGSKIDLVVGDGLGATGFEVPCVVGQLLDEATVTIKGSNLQVSVVGYDPLSTDPPGTITKQKPACDAGNQIREGEVMDVWVAGPAPTNP